jgi:hypothetical protein
MDTPERRVWGERRPKDMVTSQIILVFELTHPKTFTQAVQVHLTNICTHVSVVSVRKYLYIATG